VDEFLLMTDEQRTKLKWTYLLEKLRFGIQVIQIPSNFPIHFFLFQMKNSSNYVKPIIRIACLFPREYLPISIDDQ
jgi:hypothetical protein